MNLYSQYSRVGETSRFFLDWWQKTFILLQFHYPFNNLKECVCEQKNWTVIMAGPSVREGLNKFPHFQDISVESRQIKPEKPADWAALMWIQTSHLTGTQIEISVRNYFNVLIAFRHVFVVFIKTNGGHVTPPLSLVSSSTATVPTSHRPATKQQEALWSKPLI